MGATAPVTMAGTLVMQNAEVLAGMVLTQLVNPGIGNELAGSTCLDGLDNDCDGVQDCNDTDVPDTCEAIADSDFNSDGSVSLFDYASFVDALAGPDLPPNPADTACASACLAAFDSDGDSDLDLKDFDALARLFGP